MNILNHRYTTDEYGILSLEDPQDFTYDIDYVKDRYDSYGWQTRAMSLLRLHFIRNNMEIKGSSILDVGYGNGDFLNICGAHGMYPWGYDVSGYPLSETVKKAETMVEQHYDIITFFDSLEHFKSLTFVEDLDCKNICISVPWCHYPHEKTHIEWLNTWKHLRPEEHFHHFTRRALRDFMKDMGYTMVEYDNLEDSIRGIGVGGVPNILTAFFTRGVK